MRKKASVNLLSVLKYSAPPRRAMITINILCRPCPAVSPQISRAAPQRKQKSRSAKNVNAG